MNKIKEICGFIVPVGFYVYSAKRGHGSFLILELCDPCEKTVSGVEAEYLLWVYLSDWEIYQSQARTLDCDVTDDHLYSKVLSDFIGAKLVDVIVDSEGDAIKFVFDNGGYISLESDLDEYEDSDDLFMLFNRFSGKVLSYSPVKGFYVEDGKKAQPQ